MRCPHARKKKNITLTDDQVRYIRNNFHTIQRKLLPGILGITKGKLDANLHIMEGLEFKKTRPRKSATAAGFFDWDNY